MESNETQASQPQDDTLRVRIVRNSRPVVLEDESGVERQYILREMLGTTKGRWQTGMAKRVRFDGKGTYAGIQDYTGLEAALICLCLYHADTNTLVPENVIAQWPTTVQKALFEACQEINGLSDEAEKKEKKG